MKSFLILIATTLCLSNASFSLAAQMKADVTEQKLARLEKEFGGKIGLYAINTGNNQIISYHANDRFPVQSTFKLIGVAALLKESDKKPNLLNEVIHYAQNDLLAWHPITGRHVSDGMTLEALSEAAVSYSDNPAINLIMKKLGGPAKITNFARSIGNESFNIMHYERNLNSDPKNNQDTSTPKDMAMSVKKIVLGDVLTENSKSKLITWMKDSTTSYKRIRSGVPIGWVVADKSGSGDYGVAWNCKQKCLILRALGMGGKSLFAAKAFNLYQRLGLSPHYLSDRTVS